MALPEDERPRPPWPGLDPKPEEITFDADVLKGIAKDLQDDLDRLLGHGAGTPTDFEKHALPKTVMMLDPSYAPGAAFIETLQNGQTYFGLVYKEIIEKYEAAIKLIEAAAGVQEKVETTNTGVTAST